MKILWFTNTPVLGRKKLPYNDFSGRWMESLQLEFEKLENLELSVSFLWGEKIPAFRIKPTQYFPIYIPDPGNPFSRWAHRLQHKLPDVKGIIDIMLTIINDYKPDIIHVWRTENPFGLIAQHASTPLLIWLQDIISVYNLKFHTAISQKEIYNFYGKRFVIYHDYYVFKKLTIQEKQVFRLNHYFTRRTSWDKRITRLMSENSSYFHCDELLRNKFYKYRWNLSNNSEYVFTSVIINPHTYKGFETIIESCLFLQKTGLVNFTWKIIGTNEYDEIINLFKRKYKIDYAETNIRFLGKLNASNLITHLLSSNIFVHSSHIENSPNSICEAMLIGMLIVATYASGVPNILENEKEGILVQDGDLYAMASAIM
jgi:glycosyltransferase involved in cell wall biosynthesis